VGTADPDQLSLKVGAPVFFIPFMDGFVFQAGTKKVPTSKYEIRSQKYGILSNIEC